METYIKIPTPDGYEISWILNAQGVSKKLIIFVHGLTGSMTEAHFYAGKEYFNQKGYDVFRFNLYAGGETSRQLHHCSIQHHSRDVETVLWFFSSQYVEVYIIGHSLGGPSITWIQVFPENLKKMIFWDPAFETLSTAHQCFEKNGIWFFYPRNGRNVEISEVLKNELASNSSAESLKACSFGYDKMYIIYAWDYNKVVFQPETNALGIISCIIEWANHGFTQEWKYEQLFEKTLEYIKK